MTQSRNILPPRRRWTDAERDILRHRYADTPTQQLADELGRTVDQVYNAADRMGLKKSAEYLAGPHAQRLRRGDEIGRAHRFTPGFTPWNKGLPGSTGTQEGCRATQFKPGRPAHEHSNHVPIGSLRVSKDGYLERKLTDDPSLAPTRRWVAVHRLVWEAAHGPIPAGHIVVFKPGQKTAELALLTVDRLELLTRRELMLRNTFHRYGPEVAKLVQLRGAITRQINKRTTQTTD